MFIVLLFHLVVYIIDAGTKQKQIQANEKNNLWNKNLVSSHGLRALPQRPISSLRLEEEVIYETNCTITIPIDSSCFESSSVYSGCDNKECEFSVCSCDPYCCEVLWDSSCAQGNNYFVPSCSAELLCCTSNIAGDVENSEAFLEIASESLVENANVSFGGKQYKSSVQYNNNGSSCRDLSCVTVIKLLNFPEISLPNGISYDKMSSSNESSSFVWYGEPQTEIGSATFTQGNDNGNLMGSANANNYVFQFQTLNDNIILTNVISQDSFPED